METELQDVASSSQDAAASTATDSSPVVETSGESPGSVTATEEAPGAQVEVDPLEGVPSTEELQRLVEQKVPHSEALARLRPAYEGLKTQLAEYKPLDSWKPLVETIGDPQLAQSSYELVSSIHTPSDQSLSGFTSVPFLQRIEQESPGTLNQIYADISAFPITDEQGNPTTVVREMYKAHGLNPDRVDEYRNIDKLRASGVVTEVELGKVPEQYREAFKSMSQAAREDLLDLMDSKPLVAEEQLRNARSALEAQQFRERDEQKQADQKQADETAFQLRLEAAVTTDVTTRVKSWTASIHQNLSSQWKPFGEDAGANSLEYAKVLSVLATLQSPAYRFVAEEALKSVGVSLDNFDDLANQWQAARSRYVVLSEMKDQWQARRAESEASLAEQRLLIKLNDYALRLAQAKSNGLTQQSQQTATQLAAAQGRFVPAGNGQAQSGFTNPYEQNPHPVGSQEYYAFNRKIDKEYSLTNASVFQ